MHTWWPGWDNSLLLFKKNPDMKTSICSSFQNSVQEAIERRSTQSSVLMFSTRPVIQDVHYEIYIFHINLHKFCEFHQVEC